MVLGAVESVGVGSQLTDEQMSDRAHTVETLTNALGEERLEELREWGAVMTEMEAIACARRTIDRLLAAATTARD